MARTERGWGLIGLELVGPGISKNSWSKGQPRANFLAASARFNSAVLLTGTHIQEAQQSKYQADRCMRDQLEKQHRAAFACNVSCCVRRTQAHLPLCSACAFACESHDRLLALAAIVSTQHPSMHFVGQGLLSYICTAVLKLTYLAALEDSCLSSSASIESAV